MKKHSCKKKQRNYRGKVWCFQLNNGQDTNTDQKILTHCTWVWSSFLLALFFISCLQMGQLHNIHINKRWTSLQHAPYWQTHIQTYNTSTRVHVSLKDGSSWQDTHHWKMGHNCKNKGQGTNTDQKYYHTVPESEVLSSSPCSWPLVLLPSSQAYCH